MRPVECNDSAQTYGRAQREEHRALAPGLLDRLAERLLGLTCKHAAGRAGSEVRL
jgi:hypothetical protein